MHKLLGFFGDIHYTHKLLMSKLIYILKNRFLVVKSSDDLGNLRNKHNKN